MHLYADLKGPVTVAFLHCLLTLSCSFTWYMSNMATEITSGFSFVHLLQLLARCFPLRHIFVALWAVSCSLISTTGLPILLPVQDRGRMWHAWLQLARKTSKRWPLEANYGHSHAILHFPSSKWCLKLHLVPVLTAYFNFSHPVSY